MRKDVRGTRRRQRPQGWGSLLFAAVVLLVLAPLAAHAQGADTVVVAWTAPGDDGSVGTAASYELRVSTSPITSANWDQATVVTQDPLPAPSAAGTRQKSVVRGLSKGTTYWFAIKTTDDAGNQSPISNVVQWNWVYDTAPPAAPSGLSASKQSDTSVRVTWAANSEPDLNGYNVYRSLASGGPFVKLNAFLINANDYDDSGIPSGTDQVWYQLTALDDSGNESARSATVAVSLAAEATTAGWSLETGYPNPSSTGATVHIPIVVPGFGGAAALEILNDAGQRISRRDLGALAPGTTEILWDGKNDAGRTVAPGVYTAWLIAGPTRLSVRLVRVP
jgi:hypothetical protein